MTPPFLRVRGAREHNLRGVDLDLPLGAVIGLVGVSGSGKSTLAFDVLHRESRRRYADLLLAGGVPGLRAALAAEPRADVVYLDGLPPSLALWQDAPPPGRSTLSTLAEVEPALVALWGRFGVQRCPESGEEVRAWTSDDLVERLLALPEGTAVTVLAGVARDRPGSPLPLLESLATAGFARARVDGVLHRLEELPAFDARLAHDVDVVVDRFRVGADRRSRADEAVRLALRAGDGTLSVLEGDREHRWHTRPCCGDRELPPLSPRLVSWSSPVGACPACAGAGCEVCGGSRLGPDGRAVALGRFTLPDLGALPVVEAAVALQDLALPPAASEVRAEAVARLQGLVRLGLGGLPLHRDGQALSQGELHRVRLARLVATGPAGVLVVLDEPSASLPPDDRGRLVHEVERLRLAGNTVVLVEHDLELVRACCAGPRDLVVELGPGAGPEGGRVVYCGSAQDLAAADTPTGRWLAGAEPPATARGRRRSGELPVAGGALPLGVLCAVTGASGAGKSRLLDEAERVWPGRCVRVGGEGLGRTRSVVATWAGLWDPVRVLLASTREAKVRGHGPGFFSLGAAGGRCSECQGEGTVRVQLEGWPAVDTSCPACDGRRFSQAALAVQFRGRDPAALLDLTVAEARAHLAGLRKVEPVLRALQDVGLGYLRLGQRTASLSGGEARRLRLATEVARSAAPAGEASTPQPAGRGVQPTTRWPAGPGAPTGTLYLLDTPCTGLHPLDVRALVTALQALVDGGGHVVVAEHDPWLVAAADVVIGL